MSVEDAIAGAVAAQLAPMKASVDRLTAEVEALRRALPPQLITPIEATRVLRLSLSTVRRRMKDGTLPVDRTSGQPRIDLGKLRAAPESEVERLAFEIRQGGRNGH